VRQIEALSRVHELVLQGSQFIVATHSPILMAYPDALILHCGPTGLQPIRYEDTEHFRITRDFLLHRHKTLDILMGR
jgi:predicted ATPase